ncbi:MAG: DUF3352 domain-containing protein [Chloroflexota bacterium]|nr:DUF3352 domain-containing protein [Chloroflexota bacterium]
MNKALRLFLVLMIALASLTAPALAVSPDDLNALAAYFPSKAPLLISFRTDPAYVETFDSLIARINAAIPTADVPALSVGLDMAIGNIIPDASFEEDVRPWLGDVGSLGVISFPETTSTTLPSDEQPLSVIALSVTDREAAETFWETALAAADFKTETDGDYTVYEPREPEMMDTPFYIAVGDDVMFFANTRDTLPLSVNGAGSLGATEAFGDALALLPESDYNITFYVDIAPVLENAINDPMTAASLGAFTALLQSYPSIAGGATILDERSFVIDIAVPVQEIIDEAADLGLNLEPNAPLDPAFLERVPSGTPFVIHGSDLQRSYEQLIAQLRLQAENGAPGATPTEDLEDQLDQFALGFNLLTGVDFEDELLPALTGDYVLYMGLNPALADADGFRAISEILPVEFGAVFSVEDEAVLQELFESLSERLPELAEQGSNDFTTITVETEEIAGVEALVINIDDENTGFPVELVLAADDEVLFLGTRASAQASLSPDGSLLDDPGYADALLYQVDEPRQWLYMASAGLEPLLNVFEVQGGSIMGQRDAENFAGFLSLLSSATISTGYEDGVQYSRLVWTLPE